MSDTSATTFFDEVVAATGLSPLIAPFTVTRLLLRARVSGELDPAGLARALPEIESGLRVYLGDSEVAAALERLRALADI